MKITILDYKAKQVEVDIGNIDDVLLIDMEVVSGDEVLNVTYKDGSRKYFDSCDTFRLMSYDDGSYPVYITGTSVNLLENEKWKNRCTSYEGFDVE